MGLFCVTQICSSLSNFNSIKHHKWNNQMVSPKSTNPNQFDRCVKLLRLKFSRFYWTMDVNQQSQDRLILLKPHLTTSSSSQDQTIPQRQTRKQTEQLVRTESIKEVLTVPGSRSVTIEKHVWLRSQELGFSRSEKHKRGGESWMCLTILKVLTQTKSKIFRSLLAKSNNLSKIRNMFWLNVIRTCVS